MPRRRKGRGKRGRRGGGARRGPVAHLPPITKLNRGPSGFMPPIGRARLRFEKHVSFSQNTIASTSIRYQPTFAYDVDPNLGSTAMPGFAELQTLYGAYRVLRYRAKIEVTNQEAFDVTVYAIPTNADPGANVSVATAQSFLSNPASRRVTICRAGGGGSRASFRIGASVKIFAGQDWPGIQDPYAGVGSAAPSDILYLQIGAVPTNGTSTFTTSTGVAASVSIDVDICFFSNKAPPSFLPASSSSKTPNIPFSGNKLNLYHYDSSRPELAEALRQSSQMGRPGSGFPTQY